MPGYLDVGEKYSRDRLVAACACADQKLQYGYQALREVLELGEDADFLPDEDGKVQPDMTSPAPLTHKTYVDVNITERTNNKTHIYGSKQ